MYVTINRWDLSRLQFQISIICCMFYDDDVYWPLPLLHLNDKDKVAGPLIEPGCPVVQPSPITP
jgi:hypothetical protein